MTTSVSQPISPLSARAVEQTLSAETYVDSDIYHQERDTIFARTWQYVGHVESARNPGDYFVTDIAGESLIIIRDDDH